MLVILTNANKFLKRNRAAYSCAEISLNTSSKGYDVVSPCQVAQLYWERTLPSTQLNKLVMKNDLLVTLHKR